MAKKPDKFLTFLLICAAIVAVVGWYGLPRWIDPSGVDMLWILVWVFFAGLVIWMLLDHFKGIDGGTHFRWKPLDWFSSRWKVK
ncbi:MAG: hypothetical protein HQ503_12295 [Rhodospirillales bacterium]|nr:hypothetical protein [Rhodospirillales bacterium]